MGLKGLCKIIRKLWIKNQQREIFESQRRVKEKETNLIREKNWKIKIRLQAYG